MYHIAPPGLFCLDSIELLARDYGFVIILRHIHAMVFGIIAGDAFVVGEFFMFMGLKS